MSYRYNNAFVKPGLNTLVSPAPIYQNYLYSWGNNGYGQLGLSNTTNKSSPNQVGALTDWASLGSGAGHSLAIKSDGTLWSWGYNAYGQLGLGSTSNYSSPKQVGSLTNWLSVAGGYQHVAAVKTDGTLWAWGNNGSGQLGLGSTTNYSSPKQVGALTDWLKVACGYYHTTAIKVDGTLWAWGFNNYGQLGLGNITNRSSPTQVGALTNWASINNGVFGYSTLAVKTDGTLWSWGFNQYNGQLGLGNTTNYSSPKQVGALTNWSKASGGGLYLAAAIKTDGTLWTWGKNNFGQLGLGNTTYYSSPKQVGSLTNWMTLCCGTYNTLATKTDKSLWAVGGRNSSGMLGLGNTTYYSSPKQVGSLTTWLSVTCGRYTALALKY